MFWRTSILPLRSFCTSLCSKQYESAISLRNLYPNSSLDITKKIETPECPENGYSGCIPIDSLNIEYKTSLFPSSRRPLAPASRTVVKFNLDSAKWISQTLKESVRHHFSEFIDADGMFTVESDKTHSQYINQADAIDTIRCMIKHAEINKKLIPKHKQVDVRSLKRQHQARVNLRVKKS